MPTLNKEKNAQYCKTYYESHKEELRQKRKEYYEANKEELKRKARESMRAKRAMATPRVGVVAKLLRPDGQSD